MSKKPRNPNHMLTVEQAALMRKKPEVASAVADAIIAKNAYMARIAPLEEARNRVFQMMVRRDAMNHATNRMRGGVGRADHKHSQFHLDY